MQSFFKLNRYICHKNRRNMKPAEIRKELHKYVDSADSETLKYFQEAIVAYQTKKQIEENKDVANFRAPLKPMTEEEYFAMIDEAEDNISKGNVYIQAEVEEMMRKRHAKV
jgi:hypothetical protein